MFHLGVNLSKHPGIIRRISSAPSEVYLTFDDGPDENFTPKVLDVLAEENWKATFFVVGQRAQKNQSLIQRMQIDGHGIMSHSIDHAYWHFFRSANHLKSWIQNSLTDLSQLTQQQQTAFRPPAGVITPPLLKATSELKTPLVLWKHRFYDTVHHLTLEKIEKNSAEIKAGDIVLLHDRQNPKRQKIFLASLRQYLQNLKKYGYTGAALSNSQIAKEIPEWL